MKPFFGIFTSLTGKLLAIYVPIVGLSLAILVAVLQSRTLEEQQQELIANLDNLITVQSSAFESAVWELDDAQIGELLRDLKLLPIVESAVVYDNTRQVLGEVGDINKKPSLPEYQAKKTLVFVTARGDRETVGELIITVNDDPIRRELQDRLKADLILFAVLVIILTAVTAFANRIVIGRPLNRLRHSIDRMRSENIREQVDWHSSDELGQVVDAYNEMQVAQAEAEQRMNEQRQVFIAAADPIVIEDLTGHVIDLNQAAEQAYGYERDELIGKPIKTIIPEDKHDHADTLLRDVLMGKEVRNVEGERVTKRGQRIDVLNTLSPLLGEDGKPISIASFAKDISQLKEAERALQKQTYELGERVKELNCLFSLSAILDEADTELLDVLSKASEIIPPGWQYPDVTCARIRFDEHSVTTRNFVESEWRQSAQVEVLGRIRGVVEVYYTESMPEEVEGPFLKEERKLIDEFARRLGAALERRESQESLRQARDDLEIRVEERTRELQLSEARLSKIMETSQDGVIVFEGNGIVTFWNPSAEEIYGIRREDIVGKSYVDIFIPERYRERTREALQRFAEIGEWDAAGRTIEVPTVRSNGEEFTTEIAFSTFFQDGMWRAVGFFRDITERKLAEDALKESESRLRTILETSAVGVGIAVEGTPIYGNSKLVEMLGFDDLNEFMNTETINSYADPADRENMLEAIRTTGHISGKEVRFKRKDGSEFWALFSVYPMEYQGQEALLNWTIDITEMKEAEAAVRASEEQVRRLFETADEGIWMIDMETKTTDANAAMLNILGRELDDIMGKPLLDFLDEKNKQSFKDQFARRKKGESGAYELEITRSDGVVVPCLINATPLYDEEGEQTGSFGMVTDITQVKEAEAILVDAIESISEGFVIYDSDDRMVICNEQYKSLFPDIADKMVPGVTFEELIDIGLARGQYGGETAERGKDDIKRERMENHRNPTGVGINQQMADGRWMMVRERRTSSGGIAGIRADITELKQTEEELMEKEAQLRLALDNMPGAIWVVDKDLRITLINDQYTEFYGGDEGAVHVGASVVDVLRAELERGTMQGEGTPEEILNQRIESFKSGKEVSFEDEVSGGRYVQLVRRPAPDGSVVNVATDVTERKEFEHMLRDARDAAESATKAKSEFLAAMSHEIRTPMNGVVGMIDLLRETELDDDQRTMMGTVRDSAFSLLQIINDILDFSKIEAGKMELEEIPVSVRDLVEGVAETLAPNANKKGVGLLAFVDPRIPDWVTGDPVRIRQILFNLGGNAVKFTETSDEKLGVVEVNAEYVDTAEDGTVTVRYAIKDNGIGIPKEAQGKLFEAFTQAESSTTRRYGGTGLGLSICTHLTDMMRGRIDVESEPGVGSEFSVTLPHAPSDKKSHRQEAKDLEGVRVLVLSGYEQVQTMLGRYLLHWHAEVETSGDLEEGFELAKSAARKKKPFDVVALGVNWDFQAKSELRERFRKLKSLSNTRFVFLERGRRKSARQSDSDTVMVDAAPTHRASFLTAVAASVGRASPEIKAEVDDEGIGARTKAPTVEEAAQSGQLILVAEDNLTNQDVIIRQLNLLGYAAEVYDDGQQAFDAYKQKHYAMLLTDCHMPVMDGFELTSAIRDGEDELDARFPIVAITANALQGEADRCIAAGMDDYLSKPLEMPKLKATLRKWMPASSETLLIPDSEITADVELPDEDAPEASTEKAAGVPPKNGDAIDPSALKDVFGDDDETFKEILGDFVDPSKANVDEIMTAYEAKSPEQVAKAAHKLKSSSRAVGANYLADLCLALETAGKAEDWKTIESEAPKVPAALGEVLDYIARL